MGPAVVSAAFAAWMLPQCLLHGQEVVTRNPRRGSVAIETPRPVAQPTRQVREGTSLQNEPGSFQITGDRMAFCPADGTDPLPALENLALERVWRMLEEVGNRPWSVSGTVTEYRGRNFLLIERAVVRSGNPTPEAKRDLVKPRS
jgi:hypothetical protein